MYARTGDFALTLRANLTTRWLRRVPVRRGVVRFFGLPKVQTPVSSFLTITKSCLLYQLLCNKLKYLYYYVRILTFCNAYANISFMSNHYPENKQNTTVDPEERRKEFLRRKLSRSERVRMRLVPLVAALGLTAVGGVYSVNEVADRLTIDETTYSVNIVTSPSILEGTKLALRDGMESNQAELAEASAHVDVSEAGSVIAHEIYNETGESARQQSGHRVVLTFETDGDIVGSELNK